MIKNIVTGRKTGRTCWLNSSWNSVFISSPHILIRNVLKVSNQDWEDLLVFTVSLTGIFYSWLTPCLAFSHLSFFILDILSWHKALPNLKWLSACAGPISLYYRILVTCFKELIDIFCHSIFLFPYSLCSMIRRKYIH